MIARKIIQEKIKSKKWAKGNGKRYDNRYKKTDQNRFGLVS